MHSKYVLHKDVTIISDLKDSFHGVNNLLKASFLVDVNSFLENYNDSLKLRTT